MTKLLSYRPTEDIRKIKEHTLVRGFAPFPVSNILVTAQTWGPSYGQNFPINYPVIYLNADYDYEGFVEAAGFPELSDEATDYLNDHEFRFYVFGPLQHGGVFVRDLIVETSPDLFTVYPYFQDIRVIPGESYKFRIGVYNTVKDQESKRMDFEYVCPTFPKPTSVIIESYGSDNYLQWDYPVVFPMSGAISNDGPGTWKVTANGVELNRSASGGAGGEGPGVPVQLLTGLLDPGTEYTLVVTPIFEDTEGNIYEYESSSLGAEIPAAPANFAAVVDGQDVNFSWDAVAGADSYDVYIDDGTGFEKHNESPIGTNSYSIEGYSAGTYDAYVVAVKNGVESAPSNEDEFTVEGVGFASTYSLLLNGSNQYVDMGFTDSSLFNRFTVEVWFKTTSQSPMAIIGSGNSGFDELIQIILNRDLSSSTVAGKIVCFIRDEDEIIFRFEITSADSSIYDGNWHHLAVVRDGNNSAKIYLDGVSKSLTSDVQMNPDSFGTFQNNLPLGANKYITNPFNLHFDGQFFEARFWSVARTEQEIQNNRNQSLVPSTDFATDFPNLEIYYQMTDETGNTISDATGNYDGTLNGNVGDNMWSEDFP